MGLDSARNMSICTQKPFGYVTTKSSDNSCNTYDVDCVQLYTVHSTLHVVWVETKSIDLHRNSNLFNRMWFWSISFSYYNFSFPTCKFRK